MKKIHIGIEDFKIIKKDFYYVDKTLFLNDIIDSSESSVMLYVRPRRFGKSLMISMLDYFFNDKYNSKDLFIDTKIYENRLDLVNYMNKINVIHLNLKSISSNNFDDFISRMKEKIIDLYIEQFKELNINNLENHYKNYINKILNNEFDYNDLVISLDRLLTIIYKIKNTKSMILIDEYDAPIQNAYNYNYFDKVKDFFRDYLGSALKGHDYLYKAILTGVNQIAQTSIFSDLNNLYVNNVLSNNNEYFGFTENETKELLNYYNYNGDFNEITKWYGGYRFQNEIVFNPWSIMYFIKNNFEFKNYWSNTGSYLFINEALTYITNNSSTALYSLFEDDVVIAIIKETMSFNDLNELNELNTLYSLLLFSGYLTYDNSIIQGQYLLKIPNKEIKESFKEEILNKYTKNEQIISLYKLKNAFINGNEDIIGNIISDYILNCFSYYDLANEKIYQIIMTTILATLFDECIIKSEVNEGLGRCDIFLRSKNNNNLAIIIEIKKLASYKTDAILQKSSETALKQIKKNNYAEEALKSNSKKILAYGIAFANKHSKVSKEQIR